MTKTDARRKRNFLDWLKKIELSVSEQPLVAIDYIFQSFGNYTDDEEIKQLLGRINKTVKEKLEVRHDEHS
ncbi:MAG: hypothetical protein ACE5GM_11405 [bacterium]